MDTLGFKRRIRSIDDSNISSWSKQFRKSSFQLEDTPGSGKVNQCKSSSNSRKNSYNRSNSSKPINRLTLSDTCTDSRLVKILMNNMLLVQNKGEKKSNTVGSLYQLFSSEYFDIHLLMLYLDRREELGVIDELINIMHEKFINESFFYIPQLCTLFTYKPYSESLENYLLDRCVDQMKFTLKVNWLVSSYIENAESKVMKKYDKLIQRIEMTLVNGRRATISNFNLYRHLHVKTEEEVYKNSLDKEYRLTYFDKTNKFYHDLKVMCEKLKDVPKENKLNPKQTRNEMLKTYLRNFNKAIKNLYVKEDIDFQSINTNTQSFFRGFILPFDDSPSISDGYNTLIVNFIPQHSFCFSTKARVPVKITVECVRVLECEDWDSLYLSDLAEEEEDVQVMVSLPNVQAEEIVHQPFQPAAGNNEIIEYSSLDDFFEKINLQEKEYLARQQEKKESEIKKIVDSVKYANEHPSENTRLSLLQKDSIVIEIQKRCSQEEDFLYDFSQDSINPFGQRWSDITRQIKEKSRFRNFETFCVKSFIAKANDDLRQEVMTMQLIKRFHDIFKNADIPLKLRPYEILITSPSSGLIEFLPNTISIDALKKHLPEKWNLNIFFRNFFNNNFEEAQKNFAESLAGYSLITYMINIRDRHNGNILLDMNGNLIHIDFGFILGISPGNLSFESAPFKLTAEYVEILDGPDSNIFHYFKSIILRGLMELRKHVDSFVKIIDIMSRGSKMPCFSKGDIQEIITAFVDRFHLNKSELEYMTVVDELIANSLGNWRTVQYDNFQKLTNDIRP